MYSPSQSAPPTFLSTQSLWVFPVHQVQALVSWIQPGLVICFTLDSILVSVLFWDIIQNEVSQKDKHQYSILMHIYGILKDGNDNPIFIYFRCKPPKEKYGLKYFFSFSVGCLFAFWVVFFCVQDFKILMKSLIYFSFVTCTFGIIFKKLLPNLESWISALVFFKDFYIFIS